MKIGIYGGSFNPIHNGHVHLIQEFSERLSLDLLLLIPTFVPPHKEGNEMASPLHRFEMCKLATEKIGDVEIIVSKVEIDRGGASYTADTLKALRKLYPTDEFYLLMGEDMFLTLDKWRSPDILFKEAIIGVAPRSMGNLEEIFECKNRLEQIYQARIRVEQIPYYDMSSTEIRKALKKGLSCKAFLLGIVEKYIQKNNVYEE